MHTCTILGISSDISGSAYGSLYQPNALGTRGGPNGANLGGRGGGIQTFNVPGSFHMDGFLLSNGADASYNTYCGGGSGGSLWAVVGEAGGHGVWSVVGGQGDHTAGTVHTSQSIVTIIIKLF